MCPVSTILNLVSMRHPEAVPRRQKIYGLEFRRHAEFRHGDNSLGSRCDSPTYRFNICK